MLKVKGGRESRVRSNEEDCVNCASWRPPGLLTQDSEELETGPFRLRAPNYLLAMTKHLTNAALGRVYFGSEIGGTGHRGCEVV